MSARNKGLLNRHLKVDQARHPLLYRWMIDNPYYWSEAAREVLEAELAAGRVPVNLRGGAAVRSNPMRPRGVHANPSSKDQAKPSGNKAEAPSKEAETFQPAPVVQGPDSAVRAAGARSTPTRVDAAPASTPSANKTTKGLQENTYATEPAPKKAAPVDTEPPQQSADRERLRKLAAETLLSNDF